MTEPDDFLILIAAFALPPGFRAVYYNRKNNDLYEEPVVGVQISGPGPPIAITFHREGFSSECEPGEFPFRYLGPGEELTQEDRAAIRVLQAEAGHEPGS